MCGIAGYFSKEPTHRLDSFLQGAMKALALRGPDLQETVTLSPHIGFGHARLSIIDTSSIANQPMADDSGRYTIIFNGEIFNYRELKEQFLSGEKFNSTSDTEVLLKLFIRMGKDCLQHLNGFFAFAVYDKETQEIFMARDRFGIKPLLVYSDDKMIVFASEMKAILAFPVKKELDYNTLSLYLQLNYIPGNSSMLKNIQKLAPGSYAVIDSKGNIKTDKYYTIPYTPGEIVKEKESYDSAKATLKRLVEEAVQRRLVADVPLGAFLSGGIDSSIITACAAKNVTNLNTYSIGFKDEPYFDETKYANLVAKKFGTNHTVFSVSNDDMFANIFSILDYIDEPFADSSAIAVYILSQKTRQKVTVALSGDGGDELFAGYNKHKAEMRARQNNLVNFVASTGLPFFKMLPKSRHSKWGNLFRQAQRFGEGLQLSPANRYWRWCTFNSAQAASALLKNPAQINTAECEKRKSFVLDAIKQNGDLNDVLYADTQMVLPNDMLTKVDLMSMANSLEVRVPLLDYTVVDYAFSLPVSYKIDATGGKKILKDAFRDVLPIELFSRPKHGFEVPLLKWMRTGLRPLIEEQLLEKNFIEQQGIFDVAAIETLKQKVYSNNPEDVHATLWGLLVFQYWYKKYMM
ncbi:MAG TPA: asparagine synthase (glutamine-hydrolyzing) [Chitinophagales bacterium]|nr:asparagine synthase (glutamine-hydrolyzing) [Chitinophagales bacterium]